MTEHMEMNPIMEIQKQPHSIFPSVEMESILRKGYQNYMEDMNLMKQICDKLTEIRRRYLIWYDGEWAHALKNTSTLKIDEYVLGLLASVDMGWITNDDFPSDDIFERMKRMKNHDTDNSNLKYVLHNWTFKMSNVTLPL
jgi:hypothetical protein